MRLKPLRAGAGSRVLARRLSVHPVQRAAWSLAVGVAMAPVLLPTGDVDVLEETISNPPVAAASLPATPDLGQPASFAGSVLIAPSRTGVNETATGASTAPAALASCARHPTTVVETNDNGYYVVVDEVGNEAGAGSAIGPVTGTDDFGVIVHGRAAGGLITVSVTLENRRTSRVSFPGGLAVNVPITRDGAPWRTVLLTDPAVAELAPGGAGSLSTTTEAEGPGQYVFAASVEMQRGTC
jgi:hypothetical protein